jgi:hypothetical protein
MIFKECKNCIYCGRYSAKIKCLKGRWIKVPPSVFFYNPEEGEKELLFLNKYESLANAIDCDEYYHNNRVYMQKITFVNFLPPAPGCRYETISIRLEPTVTSSTSTLIEYDNISKGSKIYKWAKKAAKGATRGYTCYSE